MNESAVEVWRGTLVESRHRIHIAVADAHGRLRAQSGNVALPIYARSAVKPIQAVPLIEEGVADRFEFGEREIALCCASHNGEPFHIDTVRAMLWKIGADEAALACGAHIPMGRAAAQELAKAGQQPARIHNNCSGKHAGMLALARFYGWPTIDYERPEHPVQQRMLAEMARWSGIAADDIAIAVDGCGVITFGLPLSNVAMAFAAFAAAARRADAGAARVVQAMVRQPEYVAGSERLCTDLMRVAAGRIFVKVGAEGVYCAGVPGAEIGIALKVDDGAVRAAEPALIAVLHKLALLSDEEVAELERYAEPDIVNTRGDRVGTIRAEIKLEPAQ